MTNQTFNPSINFGVTNYIYDPISGNYGLPPANGAWATVSRWQGGSPGTLVQTQANLFTSDIDTNVLPFRDTGGPYNTVSYTNASGTIQRPFGDYLDISWGASIDNWYYSNGGSAQLNAYVYFKDPDGNFFVMTFGVYDSRPEYYNYAPNVGGSGAVVYASSPVGNTKYCTSNNIMITLDTVGSGFINYTVRFTKTHFATALADRLASPGFTTVWPAPSDWLIHEVGLTHQVIQNDPGIQAHSTVSFSSLQVTNTTLAYPTNITFTQGYPSFTTMLNGIQCIPDTYDIQSTQANGYNVGAGKMTVRFDWRSHRYWEFNPNAHCAFILRASENHVRGNVITDPITGKHIRGNQGTGLLFGNLSSYSNPSTGHVGNPIYPSTIIETWYQPNGYGNDLLPGSWGNMVLQDDVTYQTEINAIIDSDGKSFVSYKLVSGGITIFDCPPIADNNTYYDPSNTGLIIGQVFSSGNNNANDPWSINLSNLSVSWSTGSPTYAIVPNVTSINEGGTVTWTVITTNVHDGTTLYWTNSGTTDENDFSDVVVDPNDRLSGNFVIANNSGTFTRTLSNDLVTEDVETIIMNVRLSSVLGTIVATAATVTVNDTSLGLPVYNVTPNQRLVKEGGVVVYTVNTENVPLNTTLFWTTDGIGTTTNADDFVDYVNSGTVVITSAELGLSKAHGRIIRRLLKDNIKDGAEAMVLRIRRGSTNGPIVAATSVVTVIDTSRTPIVNWISTGSLGTLLPGQISELYVKASFGTLPVYSKYAVTGGMLPSGLVMSRDGTISGQVTVDPTRTSFTATSTFIVSIIDPNNKTLITGQFSITVKQTEQIKRTDIYCRPFLSQDKRDSFRSLIRSETVFPTNMLYRSFDPNFGRQEDLTVYLDFGVETLTRAQYANITLKNFYKRTLTVGEIKIAVARNTDATVRYEFIYLDVIDKHVNSNKISMPLEFTFNSVTYYPPSIPNMRSRIAENSTISTVRYPSFTNHVQSGNDVKLGYIPFIPLCYCLPGKSATIIRKISENGFKFNTINFELDRIVIKDVLSETGAKYLLLSRDTKLA